MDYDNYDPRRAEIEAEIDRSMAKANRWATAMWVALGLLFLLSMADVVRGLATIESEPTTVDQLGSCND